MNNGFKVARASTCSLRHGAKYTDLLVLGDYFVYAWDEQDLAWLQNVF